MKRILLPFVSLLTALALPSCLQQATTIHLNKDGSGTIVEETTFGAQMAAMLGGIGPGHGGVDQAIHGGDLLLVAGCCWSISAG